MKENLTFSPLTKLSRAISLVSDCCWRKAHSDLDENSLGRCPKCHEITFFIDENDEESFAK